ncbi:MAG: hypothetical protein QF872_01660 [Gammaproteobacteria bacterium]|nr:hypothetical protein [Gammaproteobacteria bacterium]
MVPIRLSFSDGSAGECNIKNKYGKWVAQLPGVVEVRRSNDDLKLVCTVADGRSVVSVIHPSPQNLQTLVLSVAVVDPTVEMFNKDRSYPASHVVLIMPYQ